MNNSNSLAEAGSAFIRRQSAVNTLKRVGLGLVALAVAVPAAFAQTAPPDWDPLIDSAKDDIIGLLTGAPGLAVISIMLLIAGFVFIRRAVQRVWGAS